MQNDFLPSGGQKAVTDWSVTAAHVLFYGFSTFLRLLPAPSGDLDS
jgi:hypothetical protein